MKKLLILITTVTLCSAASAQLNKGRMMLGGSFNTQKNNTSSLDTSQSNQRQQAYHNSNISTFLRYGYFISSNWMIGLLSSYNRSVQEINTDVSNPGSSNNTSSSKNTSNSFSGGLFTRYYHMIGKSRFAWFGEATASYGGGNTKYQYEQNGVSMANPFNTGKSRSFNLDIRPGLTYFFNNTIAVEASFGNLGYYYTKNTNGTGSTPPSRTTTNSGLNSNLNFSLNSLALGINFYFGKKS